jgi:spore coat protein CotH
MRDQFFSDVALQDIHLTISERDWNALKADVLADTYYAADLTWRGITVRNVGIRSRGSGSRLAAKPGLRVDINRYRADQEFLGLKSFVLDNAATDPAFVRETVTMKLFARMNLPAPREAHTRLFVNNEYAGVYIIVESVDRTFVARTYGAAEADVEDGGFLFEYRWVRPYGFEYLGPALEPYTEIFKPETHETSSISSLYAPFEGMIRTINEARDDRFAADVGAVLDLAAFIRFLAVQSFVAEVDGFVGNWGASNFYFYRFRRNAPAVLIPWDADHAFFSGPDLPVDHNMLTNVLTARLMAAPELRRLYTDALLQVSSLAAEPA